MDRREFTKSLMGSIASYALLRTLFTTDTFADSVKPVTGGWLRGLHEMSLDLERAKITPGQWRTKIDKLYNRLALEELLARIEFARLTQGFEYPDLGVNTKWVNFPKLDGLPQTSLSTARFSGCGRTGRGPRTAIGTVSCHYVLQGEILAPALRKRSKKTARTMVIKPTVAHIARVGSHSSISDEKNNIHWLTATTDTAFTYDVLIVDLKGEK